MIRLGFGQSPFPIPSRVVAALQAHAHEKDYLPVCGLPRLREAVAAWHRRGGLADASADGVVIGPGSKELLYLVQLVADADVLLPTPCWVSYAPQAHLAGRRVVRLPTRFEDRWRLQPDQLARACATGGSRRRLLIINSPGNPEGLGYQRDELAALAAVAREHGVVILSDEIYGPLHHGDDHVSVAEHYPEGTVVTGGLSKWCGAGGWRLGTLLVPPPLRWLREALAAAASETFSAVAAPIQHAAVVAFEGGDDIDDDLRRSRAVLRTVGRATAAGLREAGVAVHDPHGGFYVMPDFSPHAARLRRQGIVDGATLCDRLLESVGVALLPGVAFERPPEELSARLAYVDFDGASALSQAGGGEIAARALAPKVMDGVAAIARWLGSATPASVDAATRSR